MSSDYIPRFFLNSLQRTLRTLPILNSCMKDRCGFQFVRYKRHCCTELVSLGARSLSAVRNQELVPQPVSIIERLSACGRARYGRFHCITFLKHFSYFFNKGVQILICFLCILGNSPHLMCKRFHCYLMHSYFLCHEMKAMPPCMSSTKKQDGRTSLIL